MKYIYILTALLAVACLSTQSYGQGEADDGNNSGADLSKMVKSNEFTPGWAIGVKASSLGFGGEVVKSLNKSFSLRLGASYYKQNFGISAFEDFDAETSNYLKTGSISLIADWYFVSFMHLSGGVMYNMTELKFEAYATESQHIGDIEVEPETIGTLYYRLNPNEISPYLGLGFGRSISRNNMVSFNFDIGAIYQGSPKVALEATGMVSPTANEDQRQLLEDNVKDFRFYPFINFQLSFRIF